VTKPPEIVELYEVNSIDDLIRFEAEFLQWSEEAAQKRDACLAGELTFNEFVMWLEQGRIRRGRKKPILKR